MRTATAVGLLPVGCSSPSFSSFSLPVAVPSDDIDSNSNNSSRRSSLSSKSLASASGDSGEEEEEEEVDNAHDEDKDFDGRDDDDEEEEDEEEPRNPLHHAVDFDSEDQRAFVAANSPRSVPRSLVTTTTTTTKVDHTRISSPTGPPVVDHQHADEQTQDQNLEPLNALEALESRHWLLRSGSDHNDDDNDDDNEDDNENEDNHDPLRLTRADMERMRVPSDNIGFLACLIPICGVTTMVSTMAMSCWRHLDCSVKYPTISWAACFFPGRYIFMFGMCTTALCIFCTICLFHWFVRLAFLSSQDNNNNNAKGGPADALPWTTWYPSVRFLAHASLICGFGASSSLFGLAVFDLEGYNYIHMLLSTTFFVFAWLTMVSIHLVRMRVFVSISSASFTQVWHRIRQGTCPRQMVACTLGRGCLYTGIAATVAFLIFFLCVNGIWPNPYNFPESYEGRFEALAIICQLFFMGSCSMELSLLNKVVENNEYLQLHRSD